MRFRKLKISFFICMLLFVTNSSYSATPPNGVTVYRQNLGWDNYIIVENLGTTVIRENNCRGYVGLVELPSGICLFCYADHRVEKVGTGPLYQVYDPHLGETMTSDIPFYFLGPVGTRYNSVAQPEPEEGRSINTRSSKYIYFQNGGNRIRMVEFGSGDIMEFSNTKHVSYWNKLMAFDKATKSLIGRCNSAQIRDSQNKLIGELRDLE